MYIIIYIILYILSYYLTRYLVKTDSERDPDWEWGDIKLNLFFSLFIVLPLILIIWNKLKKIKILEIKPPKWL